MSFLLEQLRRAPGTCPRATEHDAYARHELSKTPRNLAEPFFPFRSERPVFVVRPLGWVGIVGDAVAHQIQVHVKGPTQIVPGRPLGRESGFSFVDVAALSGGSPREGARSEVRAEQRLAAGGRRLPRPVSLSSSSSGDG